MKIGKISKISDEKINTIEHNGKKWIVESRRIWGTFVAQGLDEYKSPKLKYLQTKMLKLSDFLAEEQKLVDEYDEIEMDSAHDNLSLFREIVGEDGRAKDIDTDVIQKRFKDGKWNIITPTDIKEESDLPVTEPNNRYEAMAENAKDYGKKCGQAIYFKVAAAVVFCVGVAVEFWYLIKNR